MEAGKLPEACFIFLRMVVIQTVAEAGKWASSQVKPKQYQPRVSKEHDEAMPVLLLRLGRDLQVDR